MASNINANNIDGTYPVAGVDNDSQGFRTNFTNIKNNLAYAKAEIEDIQSNAILKSALSGTTLNNSFGGAVVSAAEIKDFRETEIDLSTASGTITLNHTAAHYHKLTTNGSFTLAFTNFPTAGKVGRIRFKVAVASVSHTMTLPAAVSLGTTGIQGLSGSVITFPASGTYIYEFITDDQGSSIHIEDLTRGRNKITDTTAATSTSTGSFTTAGGAGVAGNLYVGANLVVAGNVIVTGDIVPHFTWANVAPAGNTMSVTDTIILSSSGTITAQTLYFPSSTTAKNGETVTITSNVAITTLTIASNSATINGNVATLSANAPARWMYVAGANSWFKTI